MNDVHNYANIFLIRTLWLYELHFQSINCYVYPLWVT